MMKYARLIALACAVSACDADIEHNSGAECAAVTAQLQSRPVADAFEFHQFGGRRTAWRYEWRGDAVALVLYDASGECVGASWFGAADMGAE